MTVIDLAENKQAMEGYTFPLKLRGEEGGGETEYSQIWGVAISKSIHFLEPLRTGCLNISKSQS